MWGDLEKSTQLSRKLQHIKNKLGVYDATAQAVDNLEDFLTLAEEDGDESLAPDIERDLEKAEDDIEKLRLQTLLRGKYDGSDAILTLHAGAGGTEACDWTEMLYRMYICYSEKHGYKLTEMDRVAGDEAGIKSVTFKVEGENAYGYLKAEKGVHRLVRISPFDANARRHTSFSSVEVMPVIEDDGDIVIRPEDLKVDTYRSSGAGGQHVRSQVQNREQAMKMLMSKLIEKRESEKMEEAAEIKGEMKKIEWGSQIRSYVFCPYTMVKDHRTGCETGNVQAVMDGELDPFIIDYLKKS